MLHHGVEPWRDGRCFESPFLAVGCGLPPQGFIEDVRGNGCDDRDGRCWRGEEAWREKPQEAESHLKRVPPQSGLFVLCMLYVL